MSKPRNSTRLERVVKKCSWNYWASETLPVSDSARKSEFARISDMIKNRCGGWFLTKAQLKIQQMMLFLLAVFIFLALAGLVFLSFYLNSLHNQVNLQREEKSIINAAMLADSAEFTCGKDCIDTDKLMVLKDMPEYKDFWPVDSIEVIKLFPQEQEVECTLSNYPNCNLYKVYSKKMSSSKKVSNFVILCRKQAFQEYLGKKCELGKLVIGYEVTE